MRSDEYESIIECLIELIRFQNKTINQLQLLETKTDQRQTQKGEVSKLIVFMDLFDSLYQQNKDVEEKVFVYKLIETRKFTEEEAYSYIKKALQNGQIYERKTGIYTRA